MRWPAKYRTEKITNIMDFVCFRLVSPVNTFSRTAPTAPLWAHRPANLLWGGKIGGAGSLLRTSLYKKSRTKREKNVILGND